MNLSLLLIMAGAFALTPASTDKTKGKCELCRSFVESFKAVSEKREREEIRTGKMIQRDNAFRRYYNFIIVN